MNNKNFEFSITLGGPPVLPTKPCPKCGGRGGHDKYDSMRQPNTTGIMTPIGWDCCKRCGGHGYVLAI